MFSFFRKYQDSKKSTVQDKEADGFVLLGECLKIQSSLTNLLKGMSTPKNDNTPPLLAHHIYPEVPEHLNQAEPRVSKINSQTSEGNSVMAEILNDIPFILAPHVQELQNICQEPADRVPLYNLEEKFARFHYDFTLENSVLCGI
ncbi:hypothetical protein GDO86_011780 [Hymenochirus boettgeri]|uniref:UMA domain-containing protein n=1 Tax=Hymenochirus boettgeri TaxID=247094 RepID=A0A8T2JHH4_9PIPI|nr:hypothetical protein GDO86_011780 [Hymenochirus boettgeri]